MTDSLNPHSRSWSCWTAIVDLNRRHRAASASCRRCRTATCPFAGSSKRSSSTPLKRTADPSATVAVLESFSSTIADDLHAPPPAIDAYLAMLRQDRASTLGSDGADLLIRTETNPSKMGRMIDGWSILGVSGARNLMSQKSIRWSRASCGSCGAAPEVGAGTDRCASTCARRRDDGAAGVVQTSVPCDQVFIAEPRAPGPEKRRAPRRRSRAFRL